LLIFVFVVFTIASYIHACPFYCSGQLKLAEDGPQLGPENIMSWTMLFALLIYAGLLYLFVTRFYLLREVKLNPRTEDNPYRLARFVHGVLSVAHAFAFLAAIVWPPIWVATVLAQPDNNNLMSMKIFSGFYLDLGQFPGLEVTGLRSNILNGTMEFRTDAFNLVQWFLYSVAREIRALLALFVILHLRNIFAAITNGDAFTYANAQRLKWIGVVVLAAYMLAPLWQYFIWAAVINGIDINTAGLTFSPAFDPSYRALFVGLVVLVLSGVLKEAVQLHEEQRLTI
jgi:hypothetical protein